MTYTAIDEVQVFDVNITIPFNYPLDFYYLMDLSVTMSDDLSTIQNLSPEISRCKFYCMIFIIVVSVDTLRNLTTNFRVGFGAFSDKEALPFTNERQYVAFIRTRGVKLNQLTG